MTKTYYSIMTVNRLEVGTDAVAMWTAIFISKPLAFLAIQNELLDLNDGEPISMDVEDMPDGSCILYDTHGHLDHTFVVTPVTVDMSHLGISPNDNGWSA
jgi:hypothetical protein